MASHASTTFPGIRPERVEEQRFDLEVLRLLRIMRILGVARLLKFFCRWRAFRYMRTLAVSIASRCLLGRLKEPCKTH